jgi:hypothetical protein
MSRYNSDNSGSSSGNSGDYEDDITLKLQEYAAVRLTPKQDGLKYSQHDQYGTSLICNFEDTEVVDGIIFQRDDKEKTWKVFSADKFFNLNPEDGLVYENVDDGEYSGQMSAQDVLDHPRVEGFSENFGGEDYFYTPVAAIIEEAGDIATNDDLDVETTDEPAVSVGDTSMLLGNKPWVRTFAKKVTSAGEAAIADDDTLEDNPKYDSHDWLATEDPTFRDKLVGRELELWVTEETTEWEDGETTTYTFPNVLDVKTKNHIQIDNGSDDGGDSESDSGKAAATDGGTKTESGSTSTASPQSTESPDNSGNSNDSANNSDDSSGLPDGVPDKLDDLIDYMARNGKTDPDQLRDFAADEVDDPDEIDWEAASEVAEGRAE